MVGRVAYSLGRGASPGRFQIVDHVERAFHCGTTTQNGQLTRTPTLPRAIRALFVAKAPGVCHESTSSGRTMLYWQLCMSMDSINMCSFVESIGPRRQLTLWSRL